MTNNLVLIQQSELMLFRWSGIDVCYGSLNFNITIHLSGAYDMKLPILHTSVLAPVFLKNKM